MSILTNHCQISERTKSYALYVDLPTQLDTPENIFKECCYLHNVLASTEDESLEKNDFNGYFHKRQISSETCSFILIDLKNNTEYELKDNTYGEYKNFGSIQSQVNLKTFVLDWRKVLIDLGEGAYKVVKRINIVGIENDIEYLVSNLREYSQVLADKTVRIDVNMSGFFEKDSIDFTESNFKDSIRVPGFFGNREPQFEENYLVNRDFTKKQISIKQVNEYKFQTNSIPSCITNIIYDFILYSDDIFMNDYNSNNHSYEFKNFPVKLATNEGTTYTNTSRRAKLNLLFNDKHENNLKRNYK